MINFNDPTPDNAELHRAETANGDQDAMNALDKKNTRRKSWFRTILLWLASRLWFVCIIGSIAVCAFAIGGFARFVDNISQATTIEATQNADGIVVLTGGQSRIKQAVILLEENAGERLLITGVNKNTTLEHIAKTNDINISRWDCCVDLDHTALDTIGNARAALDWVEKNAYQSIILVTSNLHMPRSVVEFRRIMPDVQLIQKPIEIYQINQGQWYKKPEIWRALLTEYSKFLFSHLRDYFSNGIINWVRNNFSNLSF